MNRTELEKYTAILLAKQAELSDGLRNRDEILIEKTPDALDEVQLAGDRELAIRNLDRQANLLRNLRAALSRVADGNYGVCLNCEEEIKPKRLEAVPWTAYCIRCQEAADRHQFAAAETSDYLPANRESEVPIRQSACSSGIQEHDSALQPSMGGIESSNTR